MHEEDARAKLVPVLQECLRSTHPVTTCFVVADEKVFGGLLCHWLFVLSCLQENNRVGIVTVEDCIFARLICSIVEKSIADKYAQGETMLIASTSYS